MNQREAPGIIFHGIYLLQLKYETNMEFQGQLMMPNIEIGYSHKIHEPKAQNQRQALECRMVLRLNTQQESPPFKLELELAARFEATGEGGYPLEKFAEIQAPAYMMPYARELVSNLTNRGIYPVLNLPPINVQTLMQHQHEDSVVQERQTPQL